jgi:crossover junction endodeoxyribonuclease RuvC
MRILGLDLGTFQTGYGIIEDTNGEASYVTSGTIRQKGPLPERIKGIYQELDSLISGYGPDVIVVETPFVYKNPKSALRLGQIQGIVLLLTSLRELPFFEYSPLEVKLTLTGYGRASKEQVREMVKMLLGLNIEFALDASDALAVALCHLHHRVATSYD